MKLNLIYELKEIMVSKK